MRRELKRQIKQDELRTGLEKATGWVRAHSREVQMTAAAVVVLLGAGLLVQNFRDRQDANAEAAFATALDAFQAPVTSETPAAAPPGGTTYATSEEKYRKALSEFQAVEKSASGEVRQRARYYAALSQIELGDLASAEKTLGELAARKDDDDIVPSLARLALADLHRRNGQPDKAIEAYRRMLEDGGFLLPRDYVLHELAATQEAANRPQDARASYERLFQEYPGSVYAGEARQRAEYLQPQRG
ncbi:MAG TPA: tetratricopeptide repeat protein [Vicinamibacteria bacterium]|jgi:pentatricopeptide repeat protein